MLSIEKIEGDIIICEDKGGKKVKLSASQLPAGAREGDVLRSEGDGWKIDPDETQRRRSEVAQRLSKMSADTRRKNIKKVLRHTSEAISASVLAEKFRVSRQIIVGDIALMRAAGEPIIATARGYFYDTTAAEEFTYTIACRHNTNAQLLEELYLIVDQGAVALDVIVDHPVYGQLTGQLQVKSRYDADRFMQALQQSEAEPLTTLTGGVHLHTLRCPDEQCFTRIKDALRTAGILVE